MNLFPNSHGSELREFNPSHDAVGRFATRKGGKYEVRSDGKGTYTVHSGGDEVARANVARDGKGSHLTSVRVEKAHQRAGVASKLYDTIEKDLGRKLEPSPTYQTPDSKAFWAKRQPKKG